MLLPPANNEKELAVGYIRVSGERQVILGNSLATQEIQVKSCAMQRRYILLKTFVERGQSAKSDDRPVLKELLAYCKVRQGRLKVVIFPKLDRFARYSRDYQNLKHDLKRIGIRLESASEHFDDTPAGRFNESVLAAVAQLDNEVRAERAKDGHITALQEGRWPWPSPGFKKVSVNSRNTVAPKEPEAALMREAFERLARRKHRPTDVRLWLWSKGIKLSRPAFYRTIHKKLYIGILESYGVTQVAAPPIVPLVSEDLFYGAHAALRQKRTPRTYERDHADFPLRGTLMCQCGQLLTACWSQGKTQRYPYYRCTKCQNSNLAKAEVERAFTGLLNQLQPKPERVAELKARLLNRWEGLSRDLAEHQGRVDRQIASLKRLQQAIVLKTAQGVIPDELAKEQLAELQQNIVDQEQKRPQGDPAIIRPEAVTDFFFRFVSRPGSTWQQTSLPEKKHLQRFYWPSGLTYLGNGHFRTRPDDPFTGLRSALSRDLSQGAGKPNVTPNFVARKQHGLSDRGIIALGELCIKLYEEFGSEDRS